MRYFRDLSQRIAQKCAFIGKKNLGRKKISVRGGEIKKICAASILFFIVHNTLLPLTF